MTQKKVESNANATTPFQMTGDVALTGNLNVNGDITDKNGTLVPRGIILMWSGAINNIPSGWTLCNGENETPDLRNRFIVGAGQSLEPNATGGNAEIRLSINQLPSHSHQINDPGHGHVVNDPGHTHALSKLFIENADGGTGSNILRDRNAQSPAETKVEPSATGISLQTSTTGVTAGDTGAGDAFDNRPPFYALLFIMKV